MQQLFSTCASVSQTMLHEFPILLSVIAAVTFAFVAKVLVSYIAHRRQSTLFLEKDTTTTHPDWQRLQTICSNTSIDPDHIRLIKTTSTVACSFGLFEQRIILSTGLLKKLEDEAVTAVLLHEEFHLNNWHSPVLFLLFALADAVSFIPSVRDAVESLHEYFEMKADAWTVQQQGTNTHLRRALHTVLSHDHIHPVHTQLPGLNGANLERRISMLQKQDGTNTLPLHTCSPSRQQIKRTMLRGTISLAVIASFFVLTHISSSPLVTASTARGSCFESLRTTLQSNLKEIQNTENMSTSTTQSLPSSH